MKISDRILEGVLNGLLSTLPKEYLDSMAQELRLSRKVVGALGDTYIGTNGPLMDALSALDKMEDS